MTGRNVCTAALTLLLLATSAGAQGRSYRFPDPLTLVGPGSSIGVRVRDVTLDDLTKAGLTTAGGVYIEDVVAGTPAERAGLKAGDIVVEFDGERVRSVRTFSRLVSETPPQRTVKATLVRNRSRMTIDVTPEASKEWSAKDFAERFGQDFPTLRAFPRDLPPLRLQPQSPGGPNIPRFEIVPPQRRLGVTLGTLDGQMADYFGVSSGVLVSGVDRDSAASRAGVKAGDVITAVDGAAVRRPADVSQAVRDASPGATLHLTVVRDKKEMTVDVALPNVSVVPLPNAPLGASGRLHV